MDFIHSDDAPKAIGPYSQAIKAGNVIYTSGQVSLDPKSGELVSGDFASQARRVFENLRAVLRAGGAEFRNVAKWPGYRLTIEHTIHVREDHWGSGVGRQLMETLMQRARDMGKHVIVAAVSGENEGSIRFHERLGFVEVARMPEVGIKFDRWLELVLLQRTLDAD